METNHSPPPDNQTFHQSFIEGLRPLLCSGSNELMAQGIELALSLQDPDLLDALAGQVRPDDRKSPLSAHREFPDWVLLLGTRLDADLSLFDFRIPECAAQYGLLDRVRGVTHLRLSTWKDTQRLQVDEVLHNNPELKRVQFDEGVALRQLSSLSRCVELEELELYVRSRKSGAAIAGLPRLRRLTLHRPEGARNALALRELPALETLTAHQAAVDVASIARLPALRACTIEDAGYDDLSALGSAPRLQGLKVEFDWNSSPSSSPADRERFFGLRVPSSLRTLTLQCPPLEARFDRHDLGGAQLETLRIENTRAGSVDLLRGIEQFICLRHLEVERPKGSAEDAFDPIFVLSQLETLKTDRVTSTQWDRLVRGLSSHHIRDWTVQADHSATLDLVPPLESVRRFTLIGPRSAGLYGSLSPGNWARLRMPEQDSNVEELEVHGHVRLDFDPERFFDRLPRLRSLCLSGKEPRPPIELLLCHLERLVTGDWTPPRQDWVWNITEDLGARATLEGLSCRMSDAASLEHVARLRRLRRLHLRGDRGAMDVTPLCRLRNLEELLVSVDTRYPDDLEVLRQQYLQCNLQRSSPQLDPHQLGAVLERQERIETLGIPAPDDDFLRALPTLPSLRRLILFGGEFTDPTILDRFTGLETVEFIVPNTLSPEWKGLVSQQGIHRRR